MDERLGPTEMLPASHLDWAGIAPSIKPCPQAGECLLFDYRLRHRGALSGPTCTAQCLPTLLFLHQPSLALPLLILIHLMICRRRSPSIWLAQGFRTSRPSRAR